jgi:DNA mismatch endonuclease (patch repair protein)
MTDVHEPEIRSYNMRQIKGKDTKPEMLVRRFLHSKGFRYRLHVKNLPGKPDIVLPKYKTVIFINGCFWHGHKGCKYFKIPETRTEWWKDKIYETKKRDKRKYMELKKSEWKVLIIWECEIKHKKEQILESLLKSLQI